MPLTPLAAALLLTATAAAPAWADRNTLWHIISTRCVPAAAGGPMPPPCARVQLPADPAQGWALMKDRRGELQYLLLPTVPLSGIESPALLQPRTPNFFAQAWAARDLLDQRHGTPLPREAVSLTVNPVRRRSQDQLHLHISCVRPELHYRLAAAQADITPTWSPLAGGFWGHGWFVRRVDGDTLGDTNPITDVAAHVPGAAADMANTGVGVVALTFKDGRRGFVLMATRWDANDPSSGSAEHDIQDHGCAILGTGRAARVSDPQAPATED